MKRKLQTLILTIVSLFLVLNLKCQAHEISRNKQSKLSPIETAPEFDHINGYVAPHAPYSNEAKAEKLSYAIDNFKYPFTDEGGDNNLGDYQSNIKSSTPRIVENLNFELPLFGFRFNYVRVSLDGHLEFSDPQINLTYPLVFPSKNWPRENDPSFIGIFYSKCRIGSIHVDDIDQRKAGVYLRIERELQTRTDELGVEMRNRIKGDIMFGINGAPFSPKHAIITTWKNISFAGGIDNALYKTNSFQMVIATDEVYTYAIFNYFDLQWTSHTEAGGDSTNGEGGIPAFVGFNAGNGTQSYEYLPYSQSSTIRYLSSTGWGNDMPGRHIFRIDEKILVGSCNKDIDGANLPLMFAPESGNMLGGTIVNVTGPCFERTDRVTCRFDTEDVVGKWAGRNIFTCVQPPLLADGYVRLEIAVNSDPFKWKGNYFIETPATATEKIFFETNDVHDKSPTEIRISWDRNNLTVNPLQNVMISLWGYRENRTRPQFQYINTIELNVQNSGEYVISPGNFRLRDDVLTNDMQFGFLQINLTSPGENYISSVIRSKPIPLAWYFGPQWERLYGLDWSEEMCDNWLRTDSLLKNFTDKLENCPCTLKQALFDKGRFMPDMECNQDENRKCQYNKGAIHCVKTANPNEDGAGQQCCYNVNEDLMLSSDRQWGSRPQRSHDYGLSPWSDATEVPTLSHWFHDQSSFYQCCLWQEEQSPGCVAYRNERRPSQNCERYQPPGIAGIVEDLFVVTFDNEHIKFDEKGEFMLVTTLDEALVFDVQGTIEDVPANVYGSGVASTQFTSIVAAGRNSAVVEVRLRPRFAQWRYRLDVLVNGRRIYFDSQSLKVQHFPKVTVYTPTYVINQSEVLVMFQSGAGIEVVESHGFMTTKVFLPSSYKNKVQGIFGNWTTMKMENDRTIDNFQYNREFSESWRVTDKKVNVKKVALFTREFGKTSSYYNKEILPL